MSASLRRRGLDERSIPSYETNTISLNGGGRSDDDKYLKRKKIYKSLDFFPKVERDYTVKTEHGGLVSVVGYVVISILVLSEVISWISHNRSTVDNVVVDTSTNKKMQVNLNVTFPALACVDLHVDVMDVAGDSQLDIEDTLVKRRLNLKGIPLEGESSVERANRAKVEQDEKKRLEHEKKHPGYCGPCYGSKDVGECCQTCEDVISAYKTKRWNSDILLGVAEQCVREGRSERKPKKMTKGEGCNLSGYMLVNRVAGNFHIAMGEGVERDGRHIHQFLPEDAINFNASHVIHYLSFGPKLNKNIFSSTSGSDHLNVLDGVSKYTTEDNGGTGVFQYFIKIVPTIYKDSPKATKPTFETNRFFFTDRYRPLLKHLVDDEHYEMGKRKSDEKNWGFGVNKVAGANAGGNKDHHHHHIQNSILPGVFFVYEIYPFAVEISPNRVSFTHLVIRLMALVGGVYTIMSWADSFLYNREKQKMTRS